VSCLEGCRRSWCLYIVMQEERGRRQEAGGRRQEKEEVVEGSHRGWQTEHSFYSVMFAVQSER